MAVSVDTSFSVFIAGGNKPFGVCFPSHPVCMQLSLLPLCSQADGRAGEEMLQVSRAGSPVETQV